LGNNSQLRGPIW